MGSPIGVYKGRFGPRQAERLVWRAGFGPHPALYCALREQPLNVDAAPIIPVAASFTLPQVVT